MVVEPVILMLVLGAGGIAVKAIQATIRRGQDGELNEVWTTAAHRVGGVARIVPGSFFESAKRTIQVRADAVTLIADSFSQRDWATKKTVEYTRVRTVDLPGMAGVDLRVWPRGALGKATRRLGLAGAATGDPAFDEAFSVSASPRSVGVAYLDASTRSFLLNAGEGFESERKSLCVLREGIPRQASTLVDMIHFAMRLAQRWTALVAGPARIAEAIDMAHMAPFDLRAAAEHDIVLARGTRRGHETALTLDVREERIHTIVSWTDDDTRNWSLERGTNGEFAPSASLAACPEPILEIARSAPPGLVALRRVGTEVRVIFEGLTPEPAVVASVVDSVIDATASSGAYR